MTSAIMTYDHAIASFSASFEPNHSAASTVRRNARAALDDAGVPTEVASNIELIIAELTSNAVDQRPEAAVTVRMDVSSESITIAVANKATAKWTGPTSTSNGRADDGSLNDAGRGLGIVAALSDEVGVTSDGGWTSVSVRCRI